MHQGRIGRDKVLKLLKHLERGRRMHIHNGATLDEVRSKPGRPVGTRRIVEYAKASSPPMRSSVNVCARAQQCIDDSPIATLYCGKQRGVAKVVVWQGIVYLRLQLRMLFQ